MGRGGDEIESFGEVSTVGYRQKELTSLEIDMDMSGRFYVWRAAVRLQCISIDSAFPCFCPPNLYQ